MGGARGAGLSEAQGPTRSPGRQTVSSLCRLVTAAGPVSPGERRIYVFIAVAWPSLAGNPADEGHIAMTSGNPGTWLYGLDLTGDAPPTDAAEDGCGCRRPLVWDGKSAHWRHLEDGTPCARPAEATR